MQATTMSCTSFFTIRSSSIEPMVRTTPRHGSSACKKLDGVPTWLMNSLAAAFFASLDRCSCIRIATDDDSCETTDLPLILDDGNLQREGREEDGLYYTGFFVSSCPKQLIMDLSPPPNNWNEEYQSFTKFMLDSTKVVLKTFVDI